MKSKLYIIATLFVSMWATSCEHDSIFEPVDLVVSLSPSNTYKIGEPVVFEFDGHADYISVYNGEIGSKYEYKDRYNVAIEDIESCILSIGCSGRSGFARDNLILKLHISNKFVGIKGYSVPLNATNDRALIESSKVDETWFGLDLPEFLTNSDSIEYRTHDLKELGYLEDMCLGFEWNSEGVYISGDKVFSVQGSYYINAYIDVEFKGYPSRRITAKELGFLPFNLSFNATKGYDEYSCKNANGLSNTADGKTTYFHTFKGGTESEVGANHGVNTWLISTPQTLNPIAPDTGENIKGYENETVEYSHTYDKPGTYTVSFRSGVTNFVDESNKLQEMTITIVDPSMPTPPTPAN